MYATTPLLTAVATPITQLARDQYDREVVLDDAVSGAVSSA
jgi:hypothetical protein